MDIGLEPGTSSDREVAARFEAGRIPPELAMEFFPLIKYLIDTNVKRHPLSSPILYSAEQAVRYAMLGRFQLWFGKKTEWRMPTFFLFTEVEEFPAGRVCRYNLVVGSELRGIAKVLHPLVRDWAISVGCVLLEADVKPAHVRLAKRFGFQPTAIKMFAPLTEIH